MSRLRILSSIVLILSFFLVQCNNNLDKGQDEKDSEKDSLTSFEKIEKTDTSEHIIDAINFSKSFYKHYRGNYFGKQAELDLMIIRELVVFTLYYYPEYQIVTNVVNLQKKGFSYAYINDFRDTLEYWQASFVSNSKLLLHITTSVIDTDYVFREDYTNAVPLQVVEIDTTLTMLDDTSKEILKVSLSSVYTSKFRLNFLKDSFSLQKDVNDAIDDLLKYLSRLKKEEIETMFFPYNIDKFVTVEYNNKGLLVIGFNYYSYYGGAHGSNNLEFYNIDVLNKKVLKITDVLDTSGLTLKIFEKIKDIDDLFIDSDELYIPQNFILKGRKFFVVYNVYEIGSYALGPIIVEFDFSEIKENLKKEFLESFYPNIKL